MDVMSAIETRRAVKRFERNLAMSETDIRTLMEYAIMSPTSFNIQNWRFVLVTDQDSKDAIRDAGWNQPQFSDCSLLIVICGDLMAHARSPERYWRNAPAAVRGRVVSAITGYYGNDAAARHDEALRSGGIAAQTIMLAARALGYDSCPMIGFDFARVAKIVGLPPDHEIVMAVAVGRGVEGPRPRPGRIPLAEAVVHNRFPGEGTGA
ncbi:nitroreductase family protein [bacterium]|nr:nitroreductase family protein [bacterium]MBU1676682.1 nitroreductase family protein [bacterium]